VELTEKRRLNLWIQWRNRKHANTSKAYHN
jgi:hypothetical protein